MGMRPLSERVRLLRAQIQPVTAWPRTSKFSAEDISRSRPTSSRTFDAPVPVSFNPAVTESLRLAFREHHIGDAMSPVPLL